MFPTLFSAIVVFALATVPVENATRDAVDLIEVNHYYDEHGRLVFDQIIFWDWSDSDSRYGVRAWRLIKDRSQLPTRNHATGGYTASWHDGEILRRVDSPAIRETWTQYDPEWIEREILPKERRRELRAIRAITPTKPKGR